MSISFRDIGHVNICYDWDTTKKALSHIEKDMPLRDEVELGIRLMREQMKALRMKLT